MAEIVGNVPGVGKYASGIIILDQYIRLAYIARMMTLSEYLQANGIAQKHFASLIDVKQATVSRIANGEMRPSLDLAFRIERQTGGKVPASIWAEKEKGAA